MVDTLRKKIANKIIKDLLKSNHYKSTVHKRKKKEICNDKMQELQAGQKLVARCRIIDKQNSYSFQ